MVGHGFRYSGRRNATIEERAERGGETVAVRAFQAGHSWRHPRTRRLSYAGGGGGENTAWLDDTGGQFSAKPEADTFEMRKYEAWMANKGV